MKKINKSKYPRDVVAYFLLLIGGFVFQSTAAFAVDDIHDDRQFTYAGDVAAIINENCVVCHREGGIGPMELTSYENVRPWAPLIQLRVANREMPPYAYDHDIGNQNSRATGVYLRTTLIRLAWVEQGSLMGNPRRCHLRPN